METNRTIITLSILIGLETALTVYFFGKRIQNEQVCVCEAINVEPS